MTLRKRKHHWLQRQDGVTDVSVQTRVSPSPATTTRCHHLLRKCLAFKAWSKANHGHATRHRNYRGHIMISNSNLSELFSLKQTKTNNQVFFRQLAPPVQYVLARNNCGQHLGCIMSTLPQALHPQPCTAALHK